MIRIKNILLFALAASMLIGTASCGGAGGAGNTETPASDSPAGTSADTPGEMSSGTPDSTDTGSPEQTSADSHSETAADTQAGTTSDIPAVTTAEPPVETTAEIPVETTAETPVETTAETSEETTGTSADPSGEPLRFLFLGNSLMYYNDMPDIFAEIAKEQGRDVYVKSVTKGSATVSDFASTSTEVGAEALPLLKNEKWDYVVIEPSRRISPYEDTVKKLEFDSAKTIRSLAATAGAKVVLYAVWGNNNGSVVEYKATGGVSTAEVSTHSMGRAQHTKFMEDTSAELAGILGDVLVAHAGYAFENCIAADPSLNLYHTDERHPSLEGSWLAACVIYETVFGESPDRILSRTSPASVKTLVAAADKTVLRGEIPEIKDEPQAQGFKLLIVGSNLMDNYAVGKVFANIVKAADGTDVQSRYLTSSTFVMNDLVPEASDLGLREALASDEWDAIVVQVSRRNTRSAADVAASELAALKTVAPLLKAETGKVFLFTLNSKSKPSIFSAATPGYTDTGKKETYSAEDGSAYFKELADAWASECGLAVINYGQAYHGYSGITSEGVGYLQACMIYCSLFGRAVPDGVSETNGLSADAAAKIRGLAARYCGLAS